MPTLNPSNYNSDPNYRLQMSTPCPSYDAVTKGYVDSLGLGYITFSNTTGPQQPYQVGQVHWRADNQRTYIFDGTKWNDLAATQWGQQWEKLPMAEPEWMEAPRAPKQTMDEIDLLRHIAQAAEKLVYCHLSPYDAEAELRLIALKDALNRLRQAERTRRNSSPQAKIRPCDACGAAIFFALKGNMQWMAIEEHPVPAEGITPAWRWKVSFDSIHPAVAFDAKAKEAYINHYECCGAGPGPTVKAEAYLRRYAANVALLDEHVASVVEGMRAMHARYSSTTPALKPIEEDEV